jgi:YHS domain-containing protein
MEERMTTPEQVLDPVCGMLILPHEAAGTRTHHGATYHLCSAGCLLKFDGDADAYLAASRSEEFRAWQATVRTPMNSAPPPA